MIFDCDLSHRSIASAQHMEWGHIYMYTGDSMAGPDGDINQDLIYFEICSKGISNAFSYISILNKNTKGK